MVVGYWRRAASAGGLAKDTPARTANTGAAVGGGGFVEVPIIGQPVHAARCTVELDRGAGVRMTIRWEGQPGLDLVGMAESFWRHRP